MNISINEINGVTILQLEGDFISEPDQKALKEHISRFVQKGGKQFVIDLAHVKYLNSCGLGSLVCALTTIKRAGGDLRIAGPTTEVMRLFEMTRLDSILKICVNVQEALK